MWPILPGLIVGMFVHPDDFAEMLLSGVTAIPLVAGFTMLGRTGRPALVVANSIALIGAGVESWGTYQLYCS